MGGMHGLGPVAPEPGEPVFHEKWEARVLALTLAMGAHRRWNIDASRHAREKIPGADYLAMSYYQKWLAGLERLIEESGLVSSAELIALSSPTGGGGPPKGMEGEQRTRGKAGVPPSPAEFILGPASGRTRGPVLPPEGGERLLRAADVPATLARGGPASRDVAAPARFAIGDRVRARNLNPVGHTRLPRYARGRLGVIERDHGVHVLPDSNAHFRGEAPERLYGVRFAAAELWGDRRPDSVHLDLWDSYLDPA